MSWGVPNRPKVTNRFGKPTNRDGGDGDIQIKGSALGAKLFARWSGRWWDIPLSINGVTKFGVTDSDYLSIDRDSVDIYKESKKVASFGETTVIGEVGAGKSNVEITSGVVNIRNNTTDKISLSSSGVATIGKVSIASSGTITIFDKIIVNNSSWDGFNVTMGTNQGGGGYYNVSLGYYAGEAMAADTDCNRNVAIGTSALRSNDIGDSNVAIGDAAGRSIVGDGADSAAGGNNICIGAGAGYTTTAITTGKNNICIGHDAYAYSATQTKGIAIGTSINASEEVVRIGSNTDNINCDFGENATWAHSSDERIKKDITDNTLGLSFINDLRTVNFKKVSPSEYPSSFLAYEEEDTKRKNPDLVHYGFIAQDVKKSMDKVGHSNFTAWSEGEDGMQRLGEAEFITPIVKAIQELSAKLDTMQTEINNLKAE